MEDQLSLGVGDRIARSRVILINEETFERGNPRLLDSPAGCLTCSFLHDGKNWTHRHPHAVVYQYRAALYCADHIEGRLAEARRARST